MRLTEATAEFLASLTAEGRSPHTVGAYRRDLTAFCRFAGDITLDDITPALLQRFMASESVQIGPYGTQRAKSTINRYRVSLKALCAWCEARWLIQRNPTTILKCRRHRGLPPVILTEEEIEAVLGFPYRGQHAERDRALLTFMLLTGCRLGETVALNTDDIDLTSGTVTLHNPKGGDPERLPLSGRCIAALRVYLGGDSRANLPLFTTCGGRRLSCRQVQRLVEARIKEAGIAKRVTPHTLRHTFATRLYNHTGDIRLVQRALRHEHVTTTEVYAHVDPQRWREVVGNVMG